MTLNYTCRHYVAILPCFLPIRPSNLNNRFNLHNYRAVIVYPPGKLLQARAL